MTFGTCQKMFHLRKKQNKYKLASDAKIFLSDLCEAVHACLVSMAIF